MKLFLLLCCTVVVADSARAQQMHGYVFVAPTLNNGNTNTQTTFGILPPAATVSANPGSNNTFAGGAGFEERLNRWFGFGLDLAGIAPEGGKVIDNTIGTFSPNVYGHVAKLAQWLHPSAPPTSWEGAKVDVYGTAGYTVLFQSYGANAFNVGGGVNYWFQTLGVMAEYRYVRVVGSNSPVTGSPYSEIRVGFIFRTSSPK